MGTQLGEEVAEKLLWQTVIMLCVRGGTQAPRGNPMVSHRSTDRDTGPTKLRNGSLLVSVEGEPKSFLPPCSSIL